MVRSCAKTRLMSSPWSMAASMTCPLRRTKLMERKSINQEKDGHKEEQISRGTDHRLPKLGGLHIANL